MMPFNWKPISAILAAAVSLATAAAADWKDQAVIHLESTPNARLKPVPVRAVTLTDGGFWRERQRTTVEKSLPTLVALLEENGYIDNFRRLKGPDGPRNDVCLLYTSPSPRD